MAVDAGGSKQAPTKQELSVMGLRNGDLANLVDNVFEIDSYASKMGEDKNIVTLSFSVANKELQMI